MTITLHTFWYILVGLAGIASGQRQRVRPPTGVFFKSPFQKRVPVYCSVSSCRWSIREGIDILAKRYFKMFQGSLLINFFWQQIPKPGCFDPKRVLIMCSYGFLSFSIECWDDCFNSQTLVSLELHVDVVRSQSIYNFPDMDYHEACSSSLERNDLQLLQSLPIVEAFARVDTPSEVALNTLNSLYVTKGEGKNKNFNVWFHSFWTTRFLSTDSLDGSVSSMKVSGTERVCNPAWLLFYYCYIILLSVLLSLQVSSAGLAHIVYNPVPPDLTYLSRFGLSFLSMGYIKIAYFCLLSHIITRKYGSILQLIRSRKRFNRFLKFLLACLLLLNFLLIGICNPSLLNPGPNCLSVSYQNVQGLIPISHLRSDHPQLDQTKIFELNAHLYDTKPDLIILNETWLKRSIKDHEVIQNSNYDVYRNDRSQVTHPADPSNLS